MACKIRIKIGYVEIDYEGEENFFKDELPKIISEISNLLGEKIIKTIPIDLEGKIGPQKRKTGIDLSVSDFAKMLEVKSGTQLIIAAAANMTFVDEIESFTRDQIWEKMKSAPAYNKASYNNNLTKYLKQLVGKGELRQVTAEKFSLSAGKITELESLIAK